MKQFSKDLGNVSLAPKGKWSKEQEYERLALVYNACDNLSYVAKINVPSGVDIENREYWQPMNATGYADNNFINLTAENENGTITAYETLEEAVATILPINRRPGATLSFFNLNADRLDRQAEFELWQFNSTDLANWEIRDYWNNIYYNWNVFAGWYVGADGLKNHVKIPNVGQYAYVGTNLNDALLYQCRTNGTWTNTGIKVRNYISVVVSGNITIGENGNWYSDGKDTGIPATPAVDEQLDNIIIQLQQHATEIDKLQRQDVTLKSNIDSNFEIINNKVDNIKTATDNKIDTADANLQDQITSNDSDITNLTAKHESLSRTVQGIAATGGASTATNVTYNNDSSGLNAENVQDAIDEVSSIAIYDVSACNNGAVFESLQALLSSSNLSTLIPTSVRHGGMSIRYVQSSDNKYVQYILTKDEWSTSEADWEKMNLEEEVSQLELWGKTRGSLCIMKSGGGRCVNSITNDGLNVIISFYSDVTLFGNSNSQIFNNITYDVFPISGDYTIGNTYMLVADLETKTLNVVGIGDSSSIVDNSSSTKIIIAVNLWGVLISPIASLQAELYQKQYLDNDISTTINNIVNPNIATKTIISLIKSEGGKVVKSIVKSNANATIELEQDLIFIGKANSSKDGEDGYVSLVGGTFLIPNLYCLVADISTGVLSVEILSSQSLYSINSDSNKIVLAYNLWGYLSSPIASLQAEFSVFYNINSYNNKADTLDVISASQVGENIGSVKKVLGIDSYNRIAPTKIAGTEFNMPYAEQQVSYSDNRTTYTLIYDITDKCSVVKFIFRAIFNKDIGATLFFMDKSGNWLHNENAVTQYFYSSQNVNNCYEVSRKVEEGAAKAVLIIGSGGTDPLPADTTLKVGWSKVILQGSLLDKDAEPIVNEIIVAQSGGDFTSVRDAVVSITDNSYRNRYKIFVKNGTYNEIDIKTKDYVDIVGESRDGVILYTDGLRTDNSPSDYNWNFDGADYKNVPINTIPKAWKHLFIHMSNSTISNMTLKVGNCKYVIHQDNASNKYEAFVRNCTFIREEDYNTNVGEYDQGLMFLVGVGAYPGQYQRYYDCDFIMNVKNIPTNAKIENFAMFIWHNWNNMTGQEACGATFENCNLFNCGVGKLSDLGSETKDIIHLHNIHVDSDKFGLYYTVTPGFYKVDGQVISDSSQIPYCIIANIQNCNFGFTILGKDREAGISKVLNPETISLIQVNENINFGQPVTINKYGYGKQQIASIEPFGFAMQDANANDMCYISTGTTGRGLSVADTYNYGDAIYINNGKFTKVSNGNQVGICIESAELSYDGLLLIRRL